MITNVNQKIKTKEKRIIAIEEKPLQNNNMKTKYFLFSIVLCFLFSCDTNRIFEKNMAIPEDGWDISNVIKLETDIADISQASNFYVNVRHSEGYPYQNLFLFITTNFPDGKKSIDTLECILSDENGNWLGDGLGDIYDNQIPFKKNVIFPQTGKYVFEITHGMRLETVPLIMDIGLRIEKAE